MGSFCRSYGARIAAISRWFPENTGVHHEPLLSLMIAPNVILPELLVLLVDYLVGSFGYFTVLPLKLPVFLLRFFQSSCHLMHFNGVICNV